MATNELGIIITHLQPYLGQFATEFVYQQARRTAPTLANGRSPPRLQRSEPPSLSHEQLEALVGYLTDTLTQMVGPHLASKTRRAIERKLKMVKK